MKDWKKLEHMNVDMSNFMSNSAFADDVRNVLVGSRFENDASSTTSSVHRRENDAKKPVWSTSASIKGNAGDKSFAAYQSRPNNAKGSGYGQSGTQPRKLEHAKVPERMTSVSRASGNEVKGGLATVAEESKDEETVNSGNIQSEDLGLANGQGGQVVYQPIAAPVVRSSANPTPVHAPVPVHVPEVKVIRRVEERPIVRKSGVVARGVLNTEAHSTVMQLNDDMFPAPRNGQRFGADTRSSQGPSTAFYSSADPQIRMDLSGSGSGENGAMGARPLPRSISPPKKSSFELTWSDSASSAKLITSDRGQGGKGGPGLHGPSGVSGARNDLKALKNGYNFGGKKWTSGGPLQSQSRQKFYEDMAPRLDMGAAKGRISASAGSTNFGKSSEFGGNMDSSRSVSASASMMSLTFAEDSAWLSGRRERSRAISKAILAPSPKGTEGFTVVYDLGRPSVRAPDGRCRPASSGSLLAPMLPSDSDAMRNSASGYRKITLPRDRPVCQPSMATSPEQIVPFASDVLHRQCTSGESSQEPLGEDFHYLNYSLPGGGSSATRFRPNMHYLFGFDEAETARSTHGLPHKRPTPGAKPSSFASRLAIRDLDLPAVRNPRPMSASVRNIRTD